MAASQGGNAAYTKVDQIDKDNGFVCIENEELLGWATLSRVSSRCAYEGVGEVSIYVDPKYQKTLHTHSLLFDNVQGLLSDYQYGHECLKTIRTVHHKSVSKPLQVVFQKQLFG